MTWNEMQDRWIWREVFGAEYARVRFDGSSVYDSIVVAMVRADESLKAVQDRQRDKDKEKK
jgi:hypothetical protein